MSDPIPPDTKLEYAPMGGLLVRLFWMALGVVTLLATAGALWSRSSEVVFWSVLYWLNVGLILGARYIDIRYFEGQTVNLEPANIKHWTRHTALLVPLALGLWAAAVWA